MYSEWRSVYTVCIPPL